MCSFSAGGQTSGIPHSCAREAALRFQGPLGAFPCALSLGCAGSLILTSSCLHSLSREAPGAWEDVKVGGEQFLHAVQIPGQQVFAADLRHAWEVVDFLQ